jgi:hypothetical protein
VCHIPPSLQPDQIAVRKRKQILVGQRLQQLARVSVQ